MSRYKDYDATGIGPTGRLYAGDLNGIQDLKADRYNLAENLGTASLAVGEAALILSRYGAGEARISGALRTDGILRGLGGIITGAFTTVARDAIGVGLAPTGIGIFNSDIGGWQYNAGTDAARVWRPMGGQKTTVGLLSAGPPGSPADGDVWIATNADAASPAANTLGIRWCFQYNAGASSTYKWEFIGGSPTVSEVITPQSTTLGIYTYMALSTPGPSFTLARAGDYDIRVESDQTTAGQGASAYHSYDIGVTPAVDDDAAIAGSGTGYRGTASKMRRKTGLTAGTALVSKYRSDNPGTSSGATFASRRMIVMPVRIS